MQLILLAILFILCLKIFLLKRGMAEIMERLEDILQEDTNNLLMIPYRDRTLRRFAARLNEQLKILRQQRHQYKSGDQELKEAVTNISHDLRTPLTAVSGYLELLEKEQHTPKNLHYLKVIRARVNDMKLLTEELFRYSVALSTREEAPVLLSLNRHLEECLLGFYGAMKQKNIVPDISMPDIPVMRTLDETALSRVFCNIINNAIKYSDGDFCVRLDPDVTVTFTNSAENLDPVMAARLFDRFYTVETSRDSTGLGLSIAKLLTERMGGRITAEYQSGKLHIVVFFPDDTYERVYS